MKTEPDGVWGNKFVRLTGGGTGMLGGGALVVARNAEGGSGYRCRIVEIHEDPTQDEN